MSEFESTLITLNDVINKQYFFNIPIYQRLYVWGKNQIHTLLDDIVQACEESKNEFYLGGTLVIERESPKKINDKETRLFDLIDGQQRFTTLWLLSVVIGRELTEYSQVRTELGLRPRIDFAIRPQVTEFFQRILRKEPASLPEARQLEDALDEIRAFINNYKKVTERTLDLVRLSNFIRNKVVLILTIVPANTDLNKLFEVINNRGVQLQHHEILKAKLLELIPSEERECYGYVWDACSNMNGYVERHLRAVTQIDTVSLFQQKTVNQENLAKAEHVIEALKKLKKNDTLEALSLEEILNTDFTLTPNGMVKNEDDTVELPDKVNSIISFSMFLQHVLRIYLSKQSTLKNTDISKISDKDLLVIFKKHWLEEKPLAEDVKAFISLLWEARYQFDLHIIKWVLVDEEEKVHAIRRLYVNNSKDNSYLQRLSTDAAPEFALLQSMLYHSQQMTTQYWLTPLLNYLLIHGEVHAELYLKHLDNHLLCSIPNASLIERTYRFVNNPWHNEILLPASASLNLQFENGVQYPHYWFYKLEYVLYLQMKPKQLNNTFRITAKNSVEHISPQKHEDKNLQLENSVLNSFGNLALVTRSLNSELSNKDFSIKKAEFEKRHRDKGVSLKLEFVFKNTTWTKTEIDNHQEEMIRYFDAYLASVTAAALQQGSNS